MTVLGAPVLPEREVTGSAVLPLARFEARRFVRHPITWAGVVASLGAGFGSLISDAPVLDRLSVRVSWSLLLLAVAAVWLGGDAVLRARSRTDADPPQAMPVGMVRRVAGALLGLSALAGVAVITQLIMLGWALMRGSVTSVVVAELVAGPLAVWGFGLFGAAATRWLPFPSTPVLAAVAPILLYFLGQADREGGPTVLGVEWLFPLVDIDGLDIYPLTFRPAGLHLVYLVGLLALTAGIALLGRWWLGTALVVIGLSVAGVAGPAQFGEVAEAEGGEVLATLVGDTADLTCEEHAGVRLCALPGYLGWVPRWVDEMAPIVEAAPPAAIAGLEVRQYPVYGAFLFHGDVSHNQPWWFETARADWVGRANTVAVGSELRNRALATDVAGHLAGCLAESDCAEAQGVVNLWLLGHDPWVRQTEQENVVPRPDPPPYWPADEEWVPSVEVTACIAVDLWADPGTTAAIHTHWDRLTDPATTYEELGELLGVEVPAGADEFGRIAGGCP